MLHDNAIYVHSEKKKTNHRQTERIWVIESSPGSARLFYNVIEDAELKSMLLVCTTDLSV